MITLKEQYRQRDQRSIEKINETYKFKNKIAPYVIYDVPYWLFGEQFETIPEGYCGDDPDIMFRFQLDNIIKHYEAAEYDDDCYCGFFMPWFGTGVLASGFGIGIEMLYKMDPAVKMSNVKNPQEIES
jgi:hypothetical protein